MSAAPTCRVQFGGTQAFVTCAISLCGSRLLFGTKPKITACISRATLQKPKHQRQSEVAAGFPHQLRLDIHSPDSAGNTKYILAWAEQVEFDDWQATLLEGIQAPAFDALIPRGWCVVKLGFLQKKGDLHGAWKPRLFQLLAREIQTPNGTHPAVRGAKLKYFDKANKLKGCIDLGPCSRCSVSKNPNTKLHEFELETDTRIYRFVAESDEVMQEWVAALAPFIADAVVMSEAGAAFNKLHENSECTTLHYEGQNGSVEVNLKMLPSLIESGTIDDHTLVYSDRDDFPYADWVRWGECSHIFGYGETQEGCRRCNVVNSSGDGSDEYQRGDLPALVEQGTLTDDTLVYSDEMNFPFDHWVAWKDVSFLYGIGEVPVSSGSSAVDRTLATLEQTTTTSLAASFDPKVPSGWHVVKQGFLKKKGGSRRKWSIRFFQIQARDSLGSEQEDSSEGALPYLHKGAKLKYFKDYERGVDMKGCIDLGPCSRCSVSKNPNTKLHEFELETDTRIYRFVAESDEVMQEWVAALAPFIADPLSLTEIGRQRIAERQSESSASKAVKDDCDTPDLFYEGQNGSVEVNLKMLPSLIESGTIDDHTLVYSDRDDFPYADWVRWGECSHIFGYGETQEGCRRCNVVNSSGDGSDEYQRGDLPALVEQGTLTDDTLVYSDEMNFPFDHWVAWKDVSHLFLSPGENQCEAKLGNSDKMSAEEGIPPENDVSQQSKPDHKRDSMCESGHDIHPDSELNPEPEPASHTDAKSNTDPSTPLEEACIPQV